MRKPNPANLEMVRLVAERLAELLGSVVFVGGSIVDLLITDPAAPQVRSTKDVDIIVEIASRHDYYRLGETLRTLGFKEDLQSADGPVCRWVVDDIRVDVMPIHDEILGFSNYFFRIAMDTATVQDVQDGLEIRLISAPCFLATKLAAFIDRGGSDYISSSDMEDFVAVLDGRPEIIDEIIKSPPDVKKFIVEQVSILLEDRDFMWALPGHLEFDSESPERVEMFIAKLRAIAAMDLEVV